MKSNYISVMIDTNRDRKQMAWQGWLYSVQRMDLLIISISGAGIYVILETIKYSKSNIVDCLNMIKISGLFFLAAIIINFISQYYGKKANHYDMLMCDADIDFEKSQKSKYKAESTKYDTLADSYSRKTGRLTTVSMVCMFAGLLVLACYFAFIF